MLTLGTLVGIQQPLNDGLGFPFPRLGWGLGLVGVVGLAGVAGLGWAGLGWVSNPETEIGLGENETEIGLFENGKVRLHRKNELPDG